jgi:hypothetical protein
MSNQTFLYSTATAEKPLYQACPAQGQLLMAAESIPIFWYMLYDERCVKLGPEHVNPEQIYPHLTTPTAEGLARAESRWPAVRGVLGGSVTALFRTWLSFVRDHAGQYLHCETIEWSWMFDSRQKFEEELRICPQAFKHIPKRRGRKLQRNKWWDRLLSQAHVSWGYGDLRTLGNLSYCGFAYHYSVPWSEDDQDCCGAMDLKVRKAAAFGPGPADILAHLEKWGGYDEFRLAECRCGANIFRLRYHDAGVERTCTACGTVHLMCDSAENWHQFKSVEWKCKECGGSTSNVGVGFVIDGEGWVRWLYVGQRCAACGRLDHCTGWEAAGTPDLYDQV